MEELSIVDLKARAREKVTEASFAGQVERIEERMTKGKKPFYDLTVRDATEAAKLKIWGDTPSFERAASLCRGVFLRVSGKWTVGNYGLEAAGWSFDVLGEEETEALFAGGSGAADPVVVDYQFILDQVEEMADPRLQALCTAFLSKMGDRFRRTAAARIFHHARRGGLVEHVAQMMRTALAIAESYPHLNADLLVAGTLFHDCGKLWENSYPEKGFEMGFDVRGELIGHIPIGMEVVNKLWRDLLKDDAAEDWAGMEPPAEMVRLHLLHLIASHHGSHEFGSPVVPKTPEALVLHHIDNIDAKMEMFRRGYAESKQLATGIYDRAFPLPGNLIDPLPKVSATAPAEPPAGKATDGEQAPGTPETPDGKTEPPPP